MAIPTPESIDAAWLSQRLQDAGYQNEVLDFTTTQIGTGQIGKCYRFDLTLKTDDKTTPDSLVGKFASDDETSRATGVMLKNYYREVNFYQTIADQLPISTPKCYYAEIDGEGPDFCLILENMAPAVQGDQLGGCDAETAALAVNELVGLQAPAWCDESYKKYDWLYEAEENPTLNIVDLYQQILPGFVDRYGKSLTADQIGIISAVGESTSCPVFAPIGDLFCLEHVDYRLDNMLINYDVKPNNITVVDWQSIKIGRPLNDVAYFLGAGLLPGLRREVESDIVKGYHQRLLAAGIENFDWQQCWEEYRRSTFAGFAVTVIASMIVEQTKRGDEMFLTMASRHSQHALDLGASEFL